MSIVRLTVAATALTLLAGPSVAANNGGFWDRLEDRVDRRESIRDERVTHGPLDRIEDVVDRVESRRDRNNLNSPRFISRWERRSWVRRWGS